jgi:hypothetical protein
MLRPARRLAWLAPLLLLGLTRGADASPIRYDYTGVVTSAGASSGVGVGDAFSGSFTYDPGTTQPGVGIEGTNSYSLLGDSSLEVPGRATEVAGGRIAVGVTDFPPGGPFSPPGPGSSRIGLVMLSAGYGPTATLTLDSPDKSVLGGSLALPAVLSLADFPSATLSYADTNMHGDPAYSYSGVIQTLTAHAVPEPASSTMLCLMMAMAAGWAARWRRAHLEGNGRAC